MTRAKLARFASAMRRLFLLTKTKCARTRAAYAPAVTRCSRPSDALATQVREPSEAKREDASTRLAAAAAAAERRARTRLEVADKSGRALITLQRSMRRLGCMRALTMSIGTNRCMRKLFISTCVNFFLLARNVAKRRQNTKQTQNCSTQLNCDLFMCTDRKRTFCASANFSRGRRR